MQDLGIIERDYFIDKKSGKNFDRPQYQALKSVLRKGDILFIKELDRLGRNAEEIKREWQDITHEIGAHIVILDMPILDTRQYHNGLEKVISSIVLGRPKQAISEEFITVYEEWKEGSITAVEAMKRRNEA
nr:recombinase family protein [Paenibacillus farraposensis]